MANATPNRLGFKDSTSNSTFAQDNAMFLTVYGGEVMNAFRETNVAEPLHMVRNITSGRTAQFPATGKVGVSYHTPGAEILGQNMNINERTINIDNVLISDVTIAQIDELKNHYETRQEHAFQQGAALGRQFDRNVLQLTVLAARASATVSGGSGGSVLTLSTYGTVGSDLATGIFSAAQIMDEKDVPENDRYCVIKPAQYYLLAQTTDVINRDWGGSGVYAEGTVLKVAGISLVKSNNLPTSNISAVTGQNNTYSGNFSTTVASVFQKGAVGTVKLMDLVMESEWDIRRQVTLMVAKYALGHGILRPECAIELKTA